MFVVSGHPYRPLLLSQSWELGGKILGGFGTHPPTFLGAGLSILVFRSKMISFYCHCLYLHTVFTQIIGSFHPSCNKTYKSYYFLLFFIKVMNNLSNMFWITFILFYLRLLQINFIISILFSNNLVVVCL